MTHVDPNAPPGAPPLATTRGGPPALAVLGAPRGGPRAPRAFELALAAAPAGTSLAVRAAAQYGYVTKAAGDESGATPLAAPRGVDANADVAAELDLLAVHPSAAVSALDDLVKVTIIEGDTWETPRAPFEVVARVQARVPVPSGRLADSPPYWSSDALAATIGSGDLPPSLEAAVCAVCRGETAVVSVPAAAAAGGRAGVPPPPTSTDRVEFEIALTTMVQVRDLTGDGAVVKRRVRDGRGEFPADCPLQDCVVRVAVMAYNGDDAEPFWSQGGSGTGGHGDGGGAAPSPPPWTFTTGTDAAPPALDLGVRLMTPGERAELVARPSHAWGARNDAPPGWDAARGTRFVLDLLSFDAPVRDYDAQPCDRLARAGELRAQGNAVWAAGGARAGDLAAAKWAASARELANALDFCEDEEAAKQAAAGRAAAHANLALASLRAGRAGEAISWCDKCLEDDDAHVKVLLRKAAACAALGRAADAESALDAAAAADPAAAADVARERARIARERAAAAKRSAADLKGFLGSGS